MSWTLVADLQRFTLATSLPDTVYMLHWFLFLFFETNTRCSDMCIIRFAACTKAYRGEIASCINLWFAACASMLFHIYLVNLKRQNKKVNSVYHSSPRNGTIRAIYRRYLMCSILLTVAPSPFLGRAMRHIDTWGPWGYLLGLWAPPRFRELCTCL
jgi:hypothetical protein